MNDARTNAADDETGPTDEAVNGRSNLLPEEEAAGSDDPERQAAAILEESDARVRGASVEGVERRRSEDTVAPEDRREA